MPVSRQLVLHHKRTRMSNSAEDGLALLNVRFDELPAQTAVIGTGGIRFCDAPPAGLPVVDAQGGRLIPGLIDHHVHLMAAAVATTSIDLSHLSGDDMSALSDVLRGAAATGRIRAVGLDDQNGPLLDARRIDAMVSAVPVRIQYRTGSLWVLNSIGLDEALDGLEIVPEAFERDSAGRLTGRVWRGDHWLRRPAATAPSMAALGRDLARWGVTSVTDASATTDQAQAQCLALAARDVLPQRLTLMSGEDLISSQGYRVGPVKLLLDDSSLPELSYVVAMIRWARSVGRSVAAHCVTPAELALMLAAWEQAGVAAGDRVEHGAQIPESFLPGLAALGVTVIANPGFVFSRGDRYLARIGKQEQSEICRLASLQRAGIALAAGSDAPYGPLNPWVAVRAAVSRSTQCGATLGIDEQLSGRAALALFSGTAERPGAPVSRAEFEAAADVAILKPDALVGVDLDPVAATFIGGRLIYACDEIRAQIPVGLQ